MKVYKIAFLIFAQISFLVQGMEEDFPQKRQREEGKGEEALQPRQKKQKQFSQEEIEKATVALIQALHYGDVADAREALENGADINYRDSDEKYFAQDGDSILNEAMTIFIQEGDEEASAMVRFIIEQGATIDHDTMITAVYLSVPVEILVDLIRHGGDFNDTQNDLLEQTITLYLGLGTDLKDKYVASGDHDRQSALLVWLLLRVARDPRDSKWFEDLLPYAFVTPKKDVVRLEERLTPLLIALMLGHQDKAKGIIKGETDRFLLSEHEKTAIAEALIFAAARNNLEIVNLLLQNFKPVFTQQMLGEALEAAGLKDRINTLTALIHSGLLVGPDLNQALENTLMTAAAQRNVAIVGIILAFDQSKHLALKIFPAAQRMEKLSTNQDLSDEIINGFSRVRDMLVDHLDTRNIGRLIPSQDRLNELGSRLPSLIPDTYLPS